MNKRKQKVRIFFTVCKCNNLIASRQVTMTNCPSCGTLLDANSPACTSCGTPIAASMFATLESSPMAAESKRLKLDRFAPGTIISNRYRVIEYLGRGGMGEVIRAHDQELDLDV